jgi:hypothetical protein
MQMMHAVGGSQPASTNRFGKEGTPGPVMLLMSRMTPAKKAMSFPPPTATDCDGKTPIAAAAAALRNFHEMNETAVSHSLRILTQLL